MTMKLKTCLCISAALIMIFAQSVQAGTIIKLSLGSDAAADIHYDGTQLTTINDLDPNTAGDQNTAVEFLDFLSGNPPIPAAAASYSMSGLLPVGPAEVVAGVAVVQAFDGGSFSLYDASNALLLSADLDASVVAGPVGATATGALFTTTFAAVTGGSLAPMMKDDSLTLSISMTDVNGGLGFSVTEVATDVYALDSFDADITESIAADPIPEPSSILLGMMGLVGCGALRRRR